MAISKTIKAKWVKALRSGRYPQGTGKLGNKAEGFCCLGVLACVVDPKHKIHESHDELFATSNSECGVAGNPQYDDQTTKRERAAARRKMKELLGGIIPKGAWKRLTTMNDDGVKGADSGQPLFKHIANWIEKSKRI